MQLLKKGKTKDVYSLENGNFLFQFKDTTTVDEDGNLATHNFLYLSFESSKICFVVLDKKQVAIITQQLLSKLDTEKKDIVH